MKTLPSDARDKTIKSPEVAARLREYFTPAPIPPPTVVAIGRLAAEEREELIGLRAKVRRVVGDLRKAEAAARENRKAADWWRDLCLVVAIVAVVSHVVR